MSQELEKLRKLSGVDSYDRQVIENETLRAKLAEVEAERDRLRNHMRDYYNEIKALRSERDERDEAIRLLRVGADPGRTWNEDGARSYRAEVSKFLARVDARGGSR